MTSSGSVASNVSPPGPDNAQAQSLLVNLQQYPTLLALYALGLGAFAADRIIPVARALGEVTVQDDRYSGPVGVTVSTFHVLDFDAVRRAFPALQRPTPVSQRLFELLRPVIAEIVPESQQQEELFDKIEYLLGITYASQLGGGSGPTTRAMGRFFERGEWSLGTDVQRLSASLGERWDLP